MTSLFRKVTAVLTREPGPSMGVSKMTPLFRKVTAVLAREPVPTVTVLRMAGMIVDGRRGGRVINFDGVSKQLDKAFAAKNLKAVCLRINSQGGSPVQSELIASR